jgi:hypothetical protein
MNVHEQCDNIVVQLTFWKQQLFEVAKIPEHFHSQSSLIVAPEVAKLMQIVEEIGNKIDSFKAECPHVPGFGLDASHRTAGARRRAGS